ncbi:MAG: sulfurtransferase-like selenium metabolism protein YedF [Bacillota bacterium]|jgi:selenium metabolism protein YedF|nr:sulfurtransferase-like selenium metabolism protein YedF [Bacillota bacterium]
MKRTLDATGLSCPLPVLEAKKALREMETGQLEVVVDNIIALQNLEKMAKQMGLTHELQTSGEDRHTIVINLGDGEAHPRTSRGETVVVLASDQMGSGDPELGRVLMKSFIYALSELEELPAKVLLYNSGVKLAVEGADTLGDLRKLAERGVEILSCGTCLNFFNLTEQLGVGAVTNMYEILQSQMAAGRIVRP